MAVPERVVAARLNGALINEIFVLCSVELDGWHRKRVSGLTDDAEGRLELGGDFIGVGRNESVSVKRRVAGVSRGGKARSARRAVGTIGSDCAGGFRGAAAAGVCIACLHGIGGWITRVGHQWIVRSTVVGHPVERVFQLRGHVRAETDDEHSVTIAAVGVTGVMQGFGHVNGSPSAFVHVGLGF